MTTASIRIREFPHELTAENIANFVGRSPLMLEIGSHEGADTVKFLQAMPGITLYCFEPDQRPISRFKQLIIADPRVVLYEMAVAHVDGDHVFHPSGGKAGHMEDWDYSGSLNAPTGHRERSPEIIFKEPISVPCIRLDTWLANVTVSGEELEEGIPWHEVLDFAWVDPQGSQRKVIAGGQKTLARLRYLYIECHHPFPLYEGEPSREELIALLPDFEPLGIYAQDNILFKHRNL